MSDSEKLNLDSIIGRLLEVQGSRPRIKKKKKKKKNTMLSEKTLIPEYIPYISTYIIF